MIGAGHLTVLPCPMQDHRDPPAHSRLLWNSALFTAGHVLTSGGVLAYFASELGARTAQMAWL